MNGPNRGAEATGVWQRACGVLEEALRGPMRREIVERVRATGDLRAALQRLRAQFEAHDFRTASGTLALKGIVRELDARCRAEGFHPLLEWEQAAGRFHEEEIPVLLVDRFAAGGASSEDPDRAVGVILDFYLLCLLGLLVLRAWDEGDANLNLDRVNSLLTELQGKSGSGRRFAEHAGTLLFIATSNFQPDDAAYHRLLEKVWALDEPHRVLLAGIGAPVVGTHLRWALSAIYEQDLSYMRQDNFVDYPWLLFSVATLMEEYARHCAAGSPPDQRRPLAAALLAGLSADPWAFLGSPPEAMAAHRGHHARFQELFERHRDTLVGEMERLVPTKGVYNPLALHFNFPHNALVATVLLDLAGAAEANVPMDALLTPPREGGSEQLVSLGRALTGFAAAHPERRGDRAVLPVAYNEPFALRSFSRTLAALRKGLTP